MSPPRRQEEDRVMVTRDLRGSTGPRGRHRKEDSMRLQSYAGTHGADELVTAHRARIRRMIGSHRVRRIQTRVVALEDEMCGGIQQKDA